ncbi:hypothetical protein [Sphingomonas sp. HMP6]|uniref:hypothetical protein n=1 Tax=Sphingomonas sp. HMP6 TaxID=1517551 RepID=UPI0015966874|nr:hypothetical protein [Sphingomonas sp. HMP6]BCA58844.1 hypothetical protein HMP06_1613 [Sphingomonas sp. HMP6]
MNDGYICCFCGKDITKEDYAALRLIATNLWEREAAQSVYAHSRCAEDQMAFGQMSPDALLDGTTGYSAQEIIWGEDEGRRVKVPRWGCLVIAALLVAGVYLLVRALGL